MNVATPITINTTPMKTIQVKAFPGPVNARELEGAATGVVEGNGLAAVDGALVVEVVDRVVDVVDGANVVVVVVDGAA